MFTGRHRSPARRVGRFIIPPRRPSRWNCRYRLLTPPGTDAPAGRVAGPVTSGSRAGRPTRARARVIAGITPPSVTGPAAGSVRPLGQLEGRAAAGPHHHLRDCPAVSASGSSAWTQSRIQTPSLSDATAIMMTGPGPAHVRVRVELSESVCQAASESMRPGPPSPAGTDQI